MAGLRFLWILLPVLLGGCGGASLPFASANESPNTCPTDYRAETLAFLRTYLNEPTKVRDAFISEPALKAVGGHQRYIACLRYNAKKSGGEYSGTKDRVAVFRGGRFDQLSENGRELCADVAYVPFPELEHLTR